MAMTSPDRAALAKIVSIALAGQSPLPHHLVCKCTVCEMRRIAEDALARSPSPYSGAAGAGPFSTKVATEAALTLAISHIEHMASWIAKQNAGYSFESLGEDMPSIKSALEASLATTLPHYAERQTIERVIVCSLCLGTGKVYHENPPRKDTPWSRCHCVAHTTSVMAALPSIPGRDAERETIEDLAISFVSIIQDGIALQSGSKSIASAIINELLARRVRALPSITSR